MLHEPNAKDTNGRSDKARVDGAGVDSARKMTSTTLPTAANPETQICHHCSLPLPQRPIKSANLLFCCQACATVHDFIVQQGLQDFYQLRVRGSALGENQPANLEGNDFAYLDHADLRPEYVDSADPFTMNFFLQGIQCSACLWLIEKLPEILPEVRAAYLNLQNQLVRVQISQLGSFARVAQTLAYLGFRPHPVKRQSDVEALNKREQRSILMRLGVSGFLAGNIMLLSIPLYSGAQEPFYSLFRWLSFLLFTPIVAYSAWPFYTSTLRSFRHRRPSIDLPILVALWTGTALSLYRLVTHSGDLYFDSLASLIFLLLATRYILFRIQSRAMGKSQFLAALTQPLARVWNPTSESFLTMPSSRLKVGDRIEVRASERLPADARLLSSSAMLNAAILTGESRPKIFRRGEICFAGTQLTHAVAELEVIATEQDSRLGQILRRLEDGTRLVTPLVTRADRWAQNFTYTVILVAVAFIALSWHWLGEEGVLRALALVIVACPCAMAFGTPLAISLALKKAAELGFLIKQGETLEKLKHIQTIYFDKTGTLTSGEMSVLGWSSPAPSEEILDLIAALERDSQHPMGRTLFAAATATPRRTVMLREWQEIPGVGVRAEYQGDVYEIKSSQPQQPSHLVRRDATLTSCVGLYRNQQLLIQCYLGDRLRPETREMTSYLRKMGYNIQILSGDQSSVVQQLAEQIDLPIHFAHGNLSPEEKEALVLQTPHCLMIGDGANDALALKAAQVGAAVHGSMELSLQAADLYILRTGVTPVVELLAIGKLAMRGINRNLFNSLIYNGVFGISALFGLVQPLTAALLMPLSSLIILLTTLHSTRKMEKPVRFHISKSLSETDDLAEHQGNAE